MKRLFLATALLCAGPVLAEEAKFDPLTGGNAEAGAAKAATCVACHGPGGNSANPDWPKLAGQHGPFVVRQLQALKAGNDAAAPAGKKRVAPVMNPQAAPLSEQDMKDLGAYFAAQPASPGVASPESVKVAAPIYKSGDASRGLPACAACHGPAGAGNAGAGYPRIGGQHAKYAAYMLRQYKGGTGVAIDNAQTATMAAVAAKLTEAEIDALASYINGLH